MDNKALLSVIIWSAGRENLSEILYELQSKFVVKFYKYYKNRPEGIVDFINSFYEKRDFDNQHIKVRQIDGDDFLFLLVEDPDVNEKDHINQKTYAFKKYFRNRDYNNYIHSSDNEEEALRDYMSVCEGTKNDFYDIKENNNPLRITTSQTEGGLGVVEIPNFYASIIDLFNVLNKNICWLVLRNWEGFPEQLILEGHKDIDILVDDYYKALTILNAIPVFDKFYRVHVKTQINGNEYFFDVRHVGDGYYDHRWEQELLNARVLIDGFYRLNNKDYFYSLLYHAIIHKPWLSSDYVQRLTSMGKDVYQFDAAVLKSRKSAREFLYRYLTYKKYKVAFPRDLSVNYFYVWGSHKFRRFLRKFDVLEKIASLVNTYRYWLYKIKLKFKGIE